jgi:hypothetical protein
MGYYLQAVLGRELARHASAFGNARVVPLEQSVDMIPVTDELHQEIGSGDELPRFEKLSPKVQAWVGRISVAGPVAYVEAEFFGGLGGQAAVAWSEGSQSLGPIHAKDAINQALRFLGVRPDGAHDEFDAVGLGRYRNTADWIPQAT